MKLIINHQSRSYILYTLKDEHISEGYKRLWKIIRHVSSLNDPLILEKITNISKMWFYKKRLNCCYSDTNEKLVDIFDKIN